MGIESIKGAAAAYQGSVSTAEVNEETRPRVEQSANADAAEAIAQATTAIDAKPTGGDGGAATGQQNPSRQNAQIKKAVEDINKKANNSEAIFGIHEATNRVMIKIVDKDTKEVIKELPPEKTLDMIAKILEMAGLLVDEKR
jgi:flagellar protein FlaG